MNSNTILNNFITIHYYELLKITNKYTKNSDWGYELLHFVLLDLLEKKDFNVVDHKQIKYYIIRMIMVNWCQPTSPFNRRIKNPHINDLDITEALHIAAEDTGTNIHEMLSIVENEWSELDWFNKIIFEKYLTLGSLKKVSQDTRIPLQSIHRYVNQTKQTIKHNTFKRINL